MQIHNNLELDISGLLMLKGRFYSFHYVATRFNEKHFQYKLFAMVQHIGDLQSGHYFSYVKYGSEYFLIVEALDGISLMTEDVNA